MHRFSLGDLSVEGFSSGGEETWFRVHPPGLALDAGRGALPLVGASRLFLSHGHLDHSLGAPAMISYRSLHQMGTTAVYCPAPIAGALEGFIKAAAALEGRVYDCEIHPLASGERVSVGKGLEIEAFATDHVVPSLGFHLLRGKERLEPEHGDASPAELVELKRRGVRITRREEETWLSYCGDTGPGVLEREPRLLEATVLLIECTFMAPRSRQRSAELGHLHLEDLAEHAGGFRNRAILLHHVSRRHRAQDLAQRLGESLPELADRVRVLDSERGWIGVDSSPDPGGEGSR